MYGDDGTIEFPVSGKCSSGVAYLVTEYVEGQLLYDVSKNLGKLGEQVGLYFLRQIVDVLKYIHKLGVAHRDLKLENIMVDKDMNIKIIDFGFASDSLDGLTQYLGTKTYMAPEIKIRNIYNGAEVDIFSTGVIFFILVQGIFPFTEAKKDEYFFNLIQKGNLTKYWSKVNGDSRS